MARIGMTLSGIERSLLSNLAAANAQIAMSAYRMATEHKINSAADDPTGFVQLSGLQSQLNNVAAVLNNTTAAGNIVSQVQSGISGIQTQLETIRDLLLEDKNHELTPDERAAAQAGINTAVAEINNIAGTSINGKALLGGAGNFLFSGLNSSQAAGLDVYSRAGTAPTISGSVLSTATQSQTTLSLTGVIPAEGAALTITGGRGTYALPLAESETVATMVDDINMHSHETGVTAALADADTMTLRSVDYGSAATIQLQDPGALFTVDSNTPGTNASAEINGLTISADSPLVSGNRFSFGDNGFQFDIAFQPGFTGAFDTITVGNGAMSFALTQNVGSRSELAVPALYPDSLGGASGTLDQLADGGTWSGLGENTSHALRIVEEALGKITRVDGLVSGFYKAAITSASSVMSDLQKNLTDAIQSVDQVNDQEELQIQTHYQVLADNSVAGLTLLNQQRQMLSKMLLSIAGLD
jgi:flagellin